MSSSDDSEAKVFCYLCLGVVFGIVGFFRGFSLRTKKKLIENIPTSTIRAAAMGLVEVKGIARPFHGTAQTPFSKEDSVFYHYKIEEYRSSGKSGSWVTLKEFSTPDWFSLEDATGKILINPVSAELYLNADRREFFNESVNIYNIRIQQLPDVFLANGLGYTRRSLLEIPKEETADVKVQF